MLIAAGRPGPRGHRPARDRQRQHHHVGWHQVLRGDLVRRTVARHTGGGDRLPAQGGQGTFRRPFCCEANRGIEQDHHQDGQRFHHIAKRQCHPRIRYQQAHHEAAELPRDEPLSRSLAWPAAADWDRRQASGGIGASEPLQDIGAQSGGGVLYRKRVPNG